MLNLITPKITTPFIDERTGLVSRDWYIFLSTLNQALGGPAVTHGGSIFDDPSIAQTIMAPTMGDSIGDTVVQAVEKDTLLEMLEQPVGIDVLMPDVVQPLSDAASGTYVTPMTLNNGTLPASLTTLATAGGVTNIGGRSYFAASSDAYAIGARYVSTGGAVFFGATDGTSTPGGKISNNGGGTMLSWTNAGALAIPGTLSVTGALSSSGTISPQKSATASAPAYGNGLIYFDTTLNKLRVGGASAWETVTSI